MSVAEIFGKDFAAIFGEPSSANVRRRRGKSKRTLGILDAATEILEEIQPATVRAVCYRLFVAKLIPNMGKAATNSVSRLLKLAREEDRIPWEWIVDESRRGEYSNRWQSSEQLIRSAVHGYRRDYWQDQPRRVEVWSEKGTVRGTLGPVLDEYGVMFRVMHGYASATVVHQLAVNSNSSDKPFIALYVGDWDPSGKHMSDVDLPRRIEQYGGEIHVQRVALTEYDLPNLPSFDPDTKRSDPRYRWFKKSIGGRCFELDAMSPPALRGKVEGFIREQLDLETWDHAKMTERAEVQSMRAFYKSWQASICPGTAP